MDRAERGDVFSKEDVSSLCELLFFVERDLEDEASCQISWTIKDRIMETIISLVLQDSSPGSFETIARAIALMLEAMKQEAQNGREIIQKFCELNLERIQNSGKTREISAQIKKLEGALSELYDLVSTH